jgi:nucleoside-diphosphate-sugar epimerase
MARMSESHAVESPVVVTGANGFAGSHLCERLAAQGATVRAVVRRAGTSPSLPGVEEHVGEFHDPDFAAHVLAGATAAVTTVHPMADDAETQRRVGVEGTATFARAARDAGVGRLVHLSTAAVYDRSPGVGDVDESAALVPDDANVYAVTKRDTDAALAEIGGLTRVVLRPPAILGAGERSIWNTLRPAAIREAADERRAVPGKTFAWVHVTDLVGLAADVATHRLADSDDPDRGPVPGGCVAVNVAAGPATVREYFETVTRALGVEPVWDDEPAWTGQVLAHRARRWGWAPSVDLGQALAELDQGIRRAHR